MEEFCHKTSLHLAVELSRAKNTSRDPEQSITACRFSTEKTKTCIVRLIAPGGISNKDGSCAITGGRSSRCIMGNMPTVGFYKDLYGRLRSIPKLEFYWNIKVETSILCFCVFPCQWWCIGSDETGGSRWNRCSCKVPPTQKYYEFPLLPPRGFPTTTWLWYVKKRSLENVHIHLRIKEISVSLLYCSSLDRSCFSQSDNSGTGTRQGFIIWHEGAVCRASLSGGRGVYPIWKGRGCSSYRLGVKIASSGMSSWKWGPRNARGPWHGELLNCLDW